MKIEIIPTAKGYAVLWTYPNGDNVVVGAGKTADLARQCAIERLTEAVSLCVVAYPKDPQDFGHGTKSAQESLDLLIKHISVKDKMIDAMNDADSEAKK